MQVYYFRKNGGFLDLVLMAEWRLAFSFKCYAGSKLMRIRSIQLDSIETLMTRKTYSFCESSPRGSALEHMVACMFRQVCGFIVTEQYRTGSRSTIDGAKITVDGYIHPCQEWPQGLCYECKAQDVNGSAHKRLVYHIEDAQQGVYPAPLLFVIDGAFFAKDLAGQKTVQWMKSKVDGEIVVAVLNTSEFVTWCQRYQGRQGCFA